MSNRHLRIVRSVRRLTRLTFGELVAAAYDVVGSGPRAAEKVADLLAEAQLLTALAPRLEIVRR